MLNTGIDNPFRCRAPMAHDEWTKTLPDGRVAKFIYDEVVQVCSATMEVGEYSKSRSSLKGPLTREEVEQLFVHDLRRLSGRRSAGHS